MINIKDVIGLAKDTIYCIVIAKTYCYQTAVSKAAYLIKTDIWDIIAFCFCPANSQETK